MDQAVRKPDIDFEFNEPTEQRVAHRYSLLIRPAKIASPQGEFVCVLRDVSATGVSVKLFHKLPKCERFTLELQNGHSYEVVNVWQRDGEAGFEFDQQIDVKALIAEASEYPKRGLRFSLSFPVTVSAISGAQMAFVENISQQGARIECADKLSIDQNVRLEGDGLRETRAKVRWRSEASYGIVFDDTFSLREFATLVARLQCPILFED